MFTQQRFTKNGNVFPFPLLFSHTYNNGKVVFGYFTAKILHIVPLIKNRLICVPQMNESLTGLEQHEGE